MSAPASAPSPANAGGEEGCLRANGSQADERHRAVLDGRTGWGGVLLPHAMSIANRLNPLPTSPCLRRGRSESA